MVNLFAPKIAIGLAGALLVSGLIYISNDYITLKSSYRVSQKTVEVLLHRRKVVDKLMLNVEKEQNVYYIRQNKALSEIDRKGYIITSGGNNPKWMQYQAQNDSKSSSAYVASR